MIRRLIILLLIGITIGQNLDNYRIRSPYISPGILVGINLDKELFWGFQLSIGLIIEGDSPNENIQTLDFISPAICYGYRKYFNSRNIEKYYDMQVTVFSDIYDSPVIGLGIGKIKYANHSSLRLKAYTWALASANVDFDVITRKTNLSIIPVLPIGNY